MNITTTIDSKTFTIDLDGSGVTIAIDGVFAGKGTWDGETVECDAPLSADVYWSIEDALTEAIEVAS